MVYGVSRMAAVMIVVVMVVAMLMVVELDAVVVVVCMNVYILCGLVCTCIHESDAELICMCFSQTF